MRPDHGTATNPDYRGKASLESKSEADSRQPRLKNQFLSELLD
jgi:hypothetical protein